MTASPFTVSVQSISHVQFSVTHGLQHTRLPGRHYLLEFAQTRAHWFSDAIQPSHSLLPPSPCFIFQVFNSNLSIFALMGMTCVSCVMIKNIFSTPKLIKIFSIKCFYGFTSSITVMMIRMMMAAILKQHLYVPGDILCPFHTAIYLILTVILWGTNIIPISWKWRTKWFVTCSGHIAGGWWR